MWREWIKTLLALTLILGALDILLPRGEIGKFAKFTIGLALMLAVLQPLTALLTPQMDLDAFLLHQPQVAHDFLFQGERLKSVAAKPFLEQQTHLQIQRLQEAIVDSTEVAEIEIEILTDNVYQPIATVKIQPFNSTNERRVKQIFKDSLGFAEQQIVVDSLYP